MDIVEQWMERRIGPAAAGTPQGRALALFHSKAWDELAEGGLGHLAYEAALRLGTASMPWVEQARGLDSSHPRRMALRAVWGGDMAELAGRAASLDPQEACRALEVCMSDKRVGDADAWRGVQASWPLALDALEPPARACEDWEPLGRLAASRPLEAARCAAYFERAMGAPDSHGRCFAQAWVRASCQAGPALDACSKALAMAAHARGGARWPLAARRELAGSVELFMEAQVEPRTSCSSSTYWGAWAALGVADAEAWSLWAKRYWGAVKSQGVAKRRAAGCSALWESLEACRREAMPIADPEVFFGFLVGVAKMHLEAWGCPGTPSLEASSRLYREAIGQALLDWSRELGPPAGGWEARRRELALALPELGAAMEAGLLAGQARVPVGEPCERRL